VVHFKQMALPVAMAAQGKRRSTVLDKHE